MAELNVQPKRKAPVWPWLLLILIIAAVAYFLLRGRQIEDAPADGTTTTDTTQQYRTDTTQQYGTDTTQQYRSDTTSP